MKPSVNEGPVASSKEEHIREILGGQEEYLRPIHDLDLEHDLHLMQT